MRSTVNVLIDKELSKKKKKNVDTGDFKRIYLGKKDVAQTINAFGIDLGVNGFRVPGYKMR
jgi:hypothetical protein